MAVITSSNQLNKKGDRIVALDWARFLATAGMVLAHLASPDHPVLNGFPAALFAVLAGVSLGIMGPGRRILIRGIILIIFGMALQLVAGTIQVVLAAMGWSFVLLTRAAGWSTRTITLVTGGAAIASALVQGYLYSSGMYLPVIGGSYPLLAWIAYMGAGILAYRLLLHASPRVLFTVTGVGVVAACLVRMVLLTNLNAFVYGALNPAAHTGGLLDLVGSAGASLAAISICLLIARAALLVNLLKPLQYAGAMSLTLYVLHIISAILYGHGAPMYPNFALVTVLLMPVLATLWFATGIRRGPLETLMHLASTTRKPQAAVPATAALLLAVAVVPSVPQAHALENARWSEPGPESNAVAAYSLNSSGTVDCTATAIADHWAITAQHCIDGEANTSGTLRFENGKLVHVEWGTGSPKGDVALLHINESIGLEHYPALDFTPKSVGARGTVYGWSPSGMARKDRLPFAEAEIQELSELPLYGGKDAFHVKLDKGAHAQGGDSGGPFFVDGKVTAVASVALGFGESSNLMAFSPLADSKAWVEETMANPQPPEISAAHGFRPDLPLWTVWLSLAILLVTLYANHLLGRRRIIKA